MGTVVFLILISLLTYWVEGRYPGFSRPDNFDRSAHTAVNVRAGLIALGATIVINFIVLMVAGWSAAHHLGLFQIFSLGENPAFSSFCLVLGFLLFDYSNYWIHRVQHQIAALWRFHRVHHTDPAIDVTSAMRFHPVESIFRGACQSVLVLAIGMPIAAFQAYLWVQTLVLVWSHANLRVSAVEVFGPLRLVVGPTMHQRHHDIARHRHDSNYGIVLSCWDHIHRTFSGRQVESHINQGLPDGTSFSQTVPGIILEPFRKVAQSGDKF